MMEWCYDDVGVLMWWTWYDGLVFVRSSYGIMKWCCDEIDGMDAVTSKRNC